MAIRDTGSVRALALVGPTSAGKTALMEALLEAATGQAVRPGEVGDSSPEAKARGHSVELNLAGFDFMGDRYAVVDCPGSLEFCAEIDPALAAVDLAIVVAEPDPAKAVLLQPTLRELERLGVPHALFINKMDQAHGTLAELLEALAPVSSAPLVARQIPTWDGDKVSGFIDLALERCFVYQPGKASALVDIPADLQQEEADARFHMLEQIADFDDELLEQLLSDVVPSRDAVFADLVREMHDGLIVPVFFGSAQNGFGVRRLLKALRHDTPPTARAAERLGVTDGAYVMKTAYAGQSGKLAYARVFGTKLPDGADVVMAEGQKSRAGGLSQVQGSALRKITEAQVGEICAIGKVEQAAAGQILSTTGRPQTVRAIAEARRPLFAVALMAKNRNDDVRLSGALGKLVEEDPGLSLTHDAEQRQVLLAGQGEGHVRLALERLKRRYGVEIDTIQPRTPYRETIGRSATQRARHKKQSGGHGQFADVTIEIRPLPRGSGVVFQAKVVGGAVPKQWIPAVETGVRDGLVKGPLGFPVTDLEVTLTDGMTHAVDSSEMAFRTVGRLAIEEALKVAGATLLEPIEKLTVYSPSNSASHVTSALTARRGQILGLGPREDWRGWERIEAYLPQSERQDLIAELRGLTQGLGAFEADFDHMSELHGRLAEEAAQGARPSA
ncbi:MAG: elongation factor G [Alphaproteobacteria bacterium]|nr:elongation factor G [Alphaproteobacteria bacterium]MBU1515808.1 elongation factor G [Alphaproteobacteria bacterium]MBU2094030.1 elongation factor G [Alphaproteobacteria bacterium]MBU2152629.1 elongation factor G [Alphaproteobacteria bacterium]MBU2308824.1 elongation factor G [Alphaproteobacteria bacterium]